jgi:acyl-CoA reductase-like NAD-dependent aldehyde dehydrogenase
MAATDTQLIVRDKLYIGGQWVDPGSDGTIDVINASTEEVMGRIPEGTAGRRRQGRRGRPRGVPVVERDPLETRVAYCTAIALKLQERQEEIAALISQELGSPIKVSMMVQAGLPSMDFASMEHLVEHIPWEQQIGNSLVVREPVGVVGAITPWNYPLHQISAKVAPAMAAGCTVVLKPSEVTPLNAFVLAEIFDEVGVPAGVLNVVTGSARSSARRSPATRRSTWSRSPARPARAGASARSPRRPSRRSRSSSAASRRT